MVFGEVPFVHAHRVGFLQRGRQFGDVLAGLRVQFLQPLVLGTAFREGLLHAELVGNARADVIDAFGFAERLNALVIEDHVGDVAVAVGSPVHAPQGSNAWQQKVRITGGRRQCRVDDTMVSHFLSSSRMGCIWLMPPCWFVRQFPA